MLKDQFIDMIREPRYLDSTQVAELENIVKEYPFFESAHLLYTKGLRQYNALNYSRQLRKTAIVANNRAVLYELLNPKETFVSPPEIKPEEPIVEPVKDVVIPEQEPVAESVIEQEKPAEEIPVVNLSPVTITSDEIKVVYITTVPQPTTEVPPLKTEEKKAEEVIPAIESVTEPLTEVPLSKPESLPQEEIEIVQHIENETQVPVQESEEEQLNRSIGQEISRSIIQSYIETEVIKTPDLQKEEPEKPLSFTDWLNKVKAEAGTLSKPEPKKEEKSTTEKTGKEEKQPKVEKKASNIEQNKNIIDKIIESDPGRIKLGSSKFFTPANDAKQSLLENEHLVTETLAKIYALQGNISKAIRAYEILSLKFPQKSVYFASLIEKLKK